MKFCMLATFFGSQSFGGDAAFVERLCALLLSAGHEVHVVHSADAYEVVRGDEPGRSDALPDGLRVHTLSTRSPVLSTLWTHQTGRMGLQGEQIRKVVERERFDVLHFHNVSLLGAPEIFSVRGGRESAVRLMTAHEYWLMCPMHVLWKFDRRVCERPQCVRCTVRSGRPPQLWRHGGAIERGLERLDALICPSRFALEKHRARGVRAPLVHLPYFLPSNWGAGAPGRPPSSNGRPYVAAAGRLVKLKGFQELIDVMGSLPDVDLRLAGVGPYEQELRRRAAGLRNVHFLGRLGESDLAVLFRSARAVVVPSLAWEVSPNVVFEAFSTGAPVVAGADGAAAELVRESAGGLLYGSRDDLGAALERLVADTELRAELGAGGLRAVRTTWSEETHLEQYLALIERLSLLRRPRVGR